MRVIAGSARRTQLVSPSGNHTRPTTDRIKETLFNMLQTDIRDSSFLDLFSGSGGIGIEALSRGAKACVFIEKDREAVRCIYKNLERTSFTEKSKVLSVDIMSGLRRLAADTEPFDIIFLDPPYAAGWEEKVIPYILASGIVKKGTRIILETSLEHMDSQINLYDVDLEKCKEYKTNCHLFYRV